MVVGALAIIGAIPLVSALPAVCNLSSPSNCATLYVRTTIRAPTGINSGRICRLIKLLVVRLRVICVFALFIVCFASTLLIVSQCSQTRDVLYYGVARERHFRFL